MNPYFSVIGLAIIATPLFIQLVFWMLKDAPNDTYESDRSIRE